MRASSAKSSQPKASFKAQSLPSSCASNCSPALHSPTTMAASVSLRVLCLALALMLVVVALAVNAVPVEPEDGSVLCNYSFGVSFGGGHAKGHSKFHHIYREQGMVRNKRYYPYDYYGMLFRFIHVWEVV